VDENEEPNDSSSSRNPSSVLKRPLDQHHLGCINLGQSVLVPYQLSASSYATAPLAIRRTGQSWKDPLWQLYLILHWEALLYNSRGIEKLIHLLF